ncbi:MAG: DUF1801 domain-containing protein [Arenimonas sp.]
MTGNRPTSIADYIEAAPQAGQAHLRKLYAILKEAAPDAGEAIKWGMPFFVEPRFLFAFSAHKTHMNLALSPAAMQHFRKPLEKLQMTKNMFQMPYDQPLREALVRKIAAYCVKTVAARKDDAFW